MLLFWATLYVLHQGSALVPVVTVQLGQPVTMTWVLNKSLQSASWLHWYKQTAGDTLKVIAIQRQNTNPTHGPGFSPTNFKATYENKMCNLTIMKTTLEDEGMYHCAYISWTESRWNGTYLSLKGNNGASSYRIIQQPAVVDPSGPEDSKTLQCSLLSQPETKTCTEDPSVFWFKAQSDKSSPGVIYTAGKVPENCEKASNAQEKCSYNFSMTVNSSDDGTFYCAVATCGQIFIGNGTKVEIAHSSSLEVLLRVMTMICLAISVTVNIVLICCRTQKTSHKNFRESASAKAQRNDSTQLDDITEDGEHLTYAALHFSTGTKKNKRELKTARSVYSNVSFSEIDDDR